MDPSNRSQPRPKPLRVRRPHPGLVRWLMHDAGVRGEDAQFWLDLLLHHALPKGNRRNACSHNILAVKPMVRRYGFQRHMGSRIRDRFLDAGLVVAIRHQKRVRVMVHLDYRCRHSGPAGLDENGVCLTCRSSLRTADDDKFPLGQTDWRSHFVTGPNAPASWPEPLERIEFGAETEGLPLETEGLPLETEGLPLETEGLPLETPSPIKEGERERERIPKRSPQRLEGGDDTTVEDPVLEQIRREVRVYASTAKESA